MIDLSFTRSALVALTLASTTAMPVLAEKASGTLNVAFTKELENVDSYFNSSREGVVMQRAVWDGLIYRDPQTNEYIATLRQVGNGSTTPRWN